MVHSARPLCLTGPERIVPSRRDRQRYGSRRRQRSFMKVITVPKAPVILDHCMVSEAAWPAQPTSRRPCRVLARHGVCDEPCSAFKHDQSKKHDNCGREAKMRSICAVKEANTGGDQPRGTQAFLGQSLLILQGPIEPLSGLTAPFPWQPSPPPSFANMVRHLSALDLGKGVLLRQSCGGRASATPSSSAGSIPPPSSPTIGRGGRATDFAESQRRAIDSSIDSRSHI